MLKVAVIGLGDISKIHIPAIQANPKCWNLQPYVILMKIKGYGTRGQILFRLSCNA